MKLSKAELAYVHYRRTGDRVDSRTRLDQLELSLNELTLDDYDAVMKLRGYVPIPSLRPLLSYDIFDLAQYLFEETGVRSPVNLSIIRNDHDSKYTYERDTDRQRLLLLALYQDYNIRPPKRLVLNDKQCEFVKAKGVVLLNGKSGTGKTTSVVERVMDLCYNQGDSDCYLNHVIIVPSYNHKSYVKRMLSDLSLHKGVHSYALSRYGAVEVKTIKDIIPGVYVGGEFIKDIYRYLEEIKNPHYDEYSYYDHRLYHCHVIVDDAQDIDNVEWLVIKKLMDMPLTLAITGDLSQCKEDHWFKQMWTQSKYVKKITLDVPTITTLVRNQCFV
jgi:hypothetical protein